MRYLNTCFMVLLAMVLLNCNQENELQDLPVLTITNTEVAPINDNLFGHFLEKANWGNEVGAYMGWDTENNKFREDVVNLMDSLEIPIIRFPGGTDVDYYQWTELIDNAPDRDTPERPNYDGRNDVIISQNQVGLHEFLDLCERLEIEPLLVINFGDAYLGKRSIEEAAAYAAGLVAYCNGTIDSIPEKYKSWVQLRDDNGRSKPWNVKFFQIGNETWGIDPPELSQTKNPMTDSIAEVYIRILDTYILEMDAVDDDITIIIDGLNGLVEPAQQHLSGKYDYMAYHHYAPWDIGEILLEDSSKVDSISLEELYYAYVTSPSADSITGQSTFSHDVFWYLRDRDIPMAMTEWNWNGWLNPNLKNKGYKESKLAEGLGAAGVLHAIMRNSDIIHLANQSMLVGRSWGITSIRVDGKTGELTMYPTGLVTGLYSRYHGNQRLESSLAGNTFYSQPYKISHLGPAKKVSYLDVVVTASEEKIYVHVINKHFTDDLSFTLNLKGLELKEDYERIMLNGEVFSKGKPNHAKHEISRKDLTLDGSLTLMAPAHSVSVFVMERE